MKPIIRTTLTLLLCGLTAIGAVGCTQVNTGTASVTTKAVVEKALDPTLTLEGVLVPSQTAILSSRISGQITTVNAATGQMVKAGQILVTLDDRALKAQLSQAQAGLQTAQAGQQMTQAQAEMTKITVDAARKNFERIKALFGSGAASQSQLDDAADKLNTAEKQYSSAVGPARNQAVASVNTAEANIRNLAVQQDYTALASPVSGVVTVQNAVIGETVSQGAALVTVADLSTLKLKGMVPQEILPSLKIGQTVAVTVAIYPDTAITGTLTGIGPTAVSTGELFPVEISVPNDGKLMAGLTASVLLTTEGRTGLVVPESAVIQESGKHFVYRIRDGVAVKSEVTPGLTHTRETEILKGLQTGDVIAVTGAGSLKDGMKVTVRQ